MQPLPTLDCPSCENFIHQSGWNFPWCNLWPFSYHWQKAGSIFCISSDWVGTDAKIPLSLLLSLFSALLCFIPVPPWCLPTVCPSLYWTGKAEKGHSTPHITSQLTQISRTRFPMHWGSHVKVLDVCKYKLSFKPWWCSTAEALDLKKQHQERKVINQSHKNFKKCPALTRFLPLSAESSFSLPLKKAGEKNYQIVCL